MKDLFHIFSYYYGKNIIEKVPGSRYNYRFCCTNENVDHDVIKLEEAENESEIVTTAENNDDGLEIIQMESDYA